MYKCNILYDIMLFTKTHFLSLNIKLNVKQAMVNTIPIVDNKMKMTVREISTVSIISIGFPSYGTPTVNMRKLSSVD